MVDGPDGKPTADDPRGISNAAGFDAGLGSARFELVAGVEPFGEDAGFLVGAFDFGALSVLGFADAGAGAVCARFKASDAPCIDPANDKIKMAASGSFLNVLKKPINALPRLE